MFSIHADLDWSINDEQSRLIEVINSTTATRPAAHSIILAAVVLNGRYGLRLAELVKMAGLAESEVVAGLASMLADGVLTRETIGHAPGDKMYRYQVHV